MSIDSQAPLGGPPIGVIGVGYVGLVTAVCFADLGYHVICRDIDADRIEALRSGRVPIFEPDVEPVLERNRDRLQFTLDLDPIVEACRVVFVCVDTPQMHSGDADLSRVHTVIDELAGCVRTADSGDEEHRPGRHRRSAAGQLEAAGHGSRTCRTPSSSARAGP